MGARRIDPRHEQLTNWLVTQRENQRLTTEQLAARFDEPHSFVISVEQGERRLDIVEFVWYCHGLGVSALDGIDAIKGN